MKNKIKSAEFIKSAASLEDCPKDGLREIAILGRSNVGKSSFLNTITGKKNLARTSSTPGRTQLINFFKIEIGNKKTYLVDLPGYGFSKVSKSQKDIWHEKLTEYIKQRQELSMVVLLIDIRHEPQKLDIETASWLDQIEMPYLIIATKSDKLKQKDKALQIKLLKGTFTGAQKFIVFSSETKIGVSEFWESMLT